MSARSIVRRALLLIALVFTAGTQEPASAGDWRERLVQPDPQFSQMPFWFWNDELDDGEIRRQMADFREKGVYGFVIHARMGLPRSIPYMGERWLGHVRAAVEEAERTGMRVCLYDEGMYPSGSAHGAVVRADPAHAAQGLAVLHRDVEGPATVDPPDATEGEHVATIAVRLIENDRLDGESLRLIAGSDAAPSGPVDVPEGTWRIMTFVQVPTGGRIRGVHEGEEDSQPGAPAAADLLNPAAMRSFLRLAYEPYHRTVGEHFGSTVIAMFTDEPSLLGRRHRRGLQPWTHGFAEYFERQRGYSLLRLLPALFFEAGEITASVKADFRRTVAERLNESYYAPLSAWCEAHGIALTGHPSGSDEISPLRYFHIPGQDLVWRYVTPGDNSALEGAHSTTGKCSSSVARHDRRQRNGNEVYGAYGWNLTLEEMKWLADWLMVRGVDLLYPHAFYYSIRGERALERPPDVGPNNTWWPHYRLFADYTSRLCGLLVDSEQVCDVAVLSVDNTLPWRAANWLFQNQVDFNYLEDWRLIERAELDGGRIAVADMRYTALIVDADGPLPAAVAARVEQVEASGVRVLPWRADTSALEIERRDIRLEPPCPHLRYIHVTRDGRHFYLLVNEGEEAIETAITVSASGRPEWFDAWTGRFTDAAVAAAGDESLTLPLRLGRRESTVLCIDPARPVPDIIPLPVEDTLVAARIVTGGWMISDADGGQLPTEIDLLPALAASAFAGTLRWATPVVIDPKPDRRYELELGRAGDWAVLSVNGRRLPPRFWAPYLWDITDAVRDGSNEVVVEITGSLAARYDPKNARPFGPLGKVKIRELGKGR